MDTPPQITFRGTQSSPAVEAQVRDRVQRLERFADRITAVRVVVEAVHRSAGGAKNPIAIAVEVDVPGRKLVARAEEPVREAKGDTLHAIVEAFAAMERQLADHARQRRQETKSHGSDEPSVGRVVRLFPEQNYGFVELRGGSELYFTRNAVEHDRFDVLEEGTEVAYTVAPDNGPMGPQARTIRPLAAGERLL